MRPLNRCDVNNSNNFVKSISTIDLACVERTASILSHISVEGISDPTHSLRIQSLRHHSQTAILFGECELSLMGNTTLRDNEHQMDETLFDLDHSLPPNEIDSTNFSPWLPPTWWTK